MNIDRHTIALVSIVGSSIDMLGALYLAYDLLGGEHGPLRTLTRGVTYGAIFGAGYTLALGPVVGIAGGICHGITLAWEFSRASKGRPKPGFFYDCAMSAIRAAGYVVGLTYLFGLAFGITFGSLSLVGQVVAYQMGIRPTLDYQSSTRPRITGRQLLAALNRTVGYVIAGYVSGVVAHNRVNSLSVGLTTGIMIGIVTAIANVCTPFIEWIADNVPEKRMGVLGVVLILVGFAFQSFQYWVSLLDVQVR